MNITVYFRRDIFGTIHIDNIEIETESPKSIFITKNKIKQILEDSLDKYITELRGVAYIKVTYKYVYNNHTDFTLSQDSPIFKLQNIDYI